MDINQPMLPNSSHTTTIHLLCRGGGLQRYPLSPLDQQYHSPPLRPTTTTCPRISSPPPPQTEHKSYATASPPRYLRVPGADACRRGLQTRFPTMEPPRQKKLGHNYRPLKQFRKLAQRLIARWLLNVILCGLLVVLFKFYENDGILSQFEKRIFNGLYLGISLFIAINMVTSLKSMADMMKWSILAGGKWTAKEINLILDISSYQRAVQLLGLWKRKPFRVLAILNWICLGIGAQVGVAILGLTFNLESDDGILTILGPVNATLLDHYYADNGGGGAPTESQEDYMAHLYGDMIYAYLTSVPTGDEPISSIGGGNGIIDDASINLADRDSFRRTNHSGWVYNYSDWSYMAGQLSPRSLRTNRTVIVKANCTRNAIIGGKAGVQKPFVIIDMNGTNQTVDWLDRLGEQGTTYVTNGTCGPRCAKIQVFKFIPNHIAQDVGSQDKQGDHFDCTVGVSSVQNAWLDEHILPDNIARRAASAIGLSGFTTPARDGFSFQSFLYNSATTWGRDVSHSPELMGTIIGLFTAGSLANMDRHNPKKQVLGHVLRAGVRLLIVWPYVWITLSIIMGGHAVLALIVCFRANKVFCKQDSPLSTARLLRPIVERLGPAGCAASGEEIAASFPMRMTYGVRSKLDGAVAVHHLDIGDDLEELKVFPAGYYD
ncbi:hypothetical protein BDD12DRAFT_821043 [Trichophaea hybrida]|nr:hypothetical protein BDD12DRAFT_821043 [Trichophaea hybrida]